MTRQARSSCLPLRSVQIALQMKYSCVDQVLPSLSEQTGNYKIPKFLECGMHWPSPWVPCALYVEATSSQILNTLLHYTKLSSSEVIQSINQLYGNEEAQVGMFLCGKNKNKQNIQ